MAKKVDSAESIVVPQGVRDPYEAGQEKLAEGPHLWIVLALIDTPQAVVVEADGEAIGAIALDQGLLEAETVDDVQDFLRIRGDELAGGSMIGRKYLEAGHNCAPLGRERYGAISFASVPGNLADDVLTLRLWAAMANQFEPIFGAQTALGQEVKHARSAR